MVPEELESEKVQMTNMLKWKSSSYKTQVLISKTTVLVSFLNIYAWQETSQSLILIDFSGPEMVHHFNSDKAENQTSLNSHPNSA